MENLLAILRAAKAQHQEESERYKRSQQKIRYFRGLIKVYKVMKGKVGNYLRENPNPRTIVSYETLLRIYSRFIFDFKEEIKDYEESYPEPSRLEIDNAEAQIALYKE